MLSLSFTEDYNIVTDIECSWYVSDLFADDVLEHLTC